jgi:hypothetical protein
LKFIYEYTVASLGTNVSEMQAMGLLEQHPELDVPRGVVQHIEELFRQVEEGFDPRELKQELDRWGVFPQYEARFLGLFRKKRT